VLGPEASVTLVCEQGLEMGRPSFVRVTLARDGHALRSVRVGGQCVAIGQGQIHLEV
jgi:trans-2,3-dihydro-3-hydroxyanthranilate isomerase